MKRFLKFGLILVIIVSSILVSGCKQEDSPETPDMDKINEVKDSVSKSNMETFNKVHEELINMLTEANDAYEDALDELAKDQSEENERAYKSAWGRLIGVTNYFDSNFKVFSGDSRLKLNNLIMDIDKIMENKQDPALVEAKIKEMDDLLSKN